MCFEEGKVPAGVQGSAKNIAFCTQFTYLSRSRCSPNLHNDTLFAMLRSCLSLFILLFALVLAGCAEPSATPSAAPEADAAADEHAMPERESMLPRTSPNAMVTQTVGVTDATITYGRPSVRDRVIYGDLVPYGEVWRTGANEATTITVEDDVMVEGEPLAAGTYALFTIPGEDTWTVIFNAEAEQWGAYNYDEAADVLRVTVEPQAASPMEMMTFTFEDVTDTSGTAVLHWAEVRVPIALQVDTDAVILAEAQERVAEAESWQMPLQYASYALRNNVHLEEALGWADAALAMEENFSGLAVKANLLAATGDHSEAVSVGEQAIAMGEAADEAPNGLDDLKASVDEWRGEM